MAIRFETINEENDGTFRVNCSGEMDMYSFPEFVSVTQHLINIRCKKLLIDFNALEYLDSSGVGAIIRLAQQCRNSKIELCFTGINGTPLKVLTMCHIISILKIV